MAIEIEITKEIGNYEPKFIGPLTIRQTGCLAVAVPICILIYITLSPVLTGDVAGFFCMIPAAFAAAFGWLKPYGMKTEEFLRYVFINTLVAPCNRKYIIDNHTDVILERLSGEDANTPAEKTEPQTQEDAVNSSHKEKTAKKKKQKKYKLSSEAVR